MTIKKEQMLTLFIALPFLFMIFYVAELSRNRGIQIEITKAIKEHKNRKQIIKYNKEKVREI